MPRACTLRLALAWIERKRSAPSRLAMAVRSSSGMKTSVSRVITTSMPGCFSSSFCTRSATSSVSSASLMPLPCAPGSWPPWPASMTTRETLEPELARERELAVRSWRPARPAAATVGRLARREQRAAARAAGDRPSVTGLLDAAGSGDDHGAVVVAGVRQVSDRRPRERGGDRQPSTAAGSAPTGGVGRHDAPRNRSPGGTAP